MSYLKNLKWNMIIMAVLTIVMGISLVASPNTAALTICRLLGWIVLISGIVSAIFYLRGSRSVWETSALVLAVIGILFGIFIIKNPGTIVKFLSYLLAAILIIHGIADIREAFEARRFLDEHWEIALVLGAISLVLGLLIVWNPFSSAAVLMTIIGLSLVYDGVSDLVIVLRLAKFAKDVKRDLETDIID